MIGILTQDEATEAAELLATADGTERVHSAMTGAAIAEMGVRWTQEHAEALLFARLQLESVLDRAGVRA